MNSIERQLAARYIYFIPYTSTTFHKFDTETLVLSPELEPQNITIGYGPNVIPLGEDVLFVQGGIINGEFISDCFFWHLSTGEFEEKPGGPINGGAAFLKVRENIYIFGGAAMNVYVPVQLSHKFCLESEEWGSIADLPKASYNNTCAALSNNRIAIVGQHLENVLYYNIESDNYVADIATGSLYKILLSHEERLFIVYCDKLKALENGNWVEYTYEITNHYTIVYSYSLYRNGYIYFVYPTKNVARLNLETKKVTRLI